MTDLVSIALKSIFSWFGLAQLAGATLLALAAIWSAKTRSVGKFLLLAAGVWLLASLLLLEDPIRWRTLLAGAIWVLGMVALYALVLSFLVAKGKHWRNIAVISAVVFVLSAPASLLPALLLTCYVGQDCM